MTDFKNPFRNVKVGVLGLGEENVALVKYLVSKNADVVVCDQKSKEELGDYYNKIKDLPIQFRLGSHYLDHLEDLKIIFRTPGLPYLEPKIQNAKEQGVEISSQIKLFFKLCPSPIIGVTGTKGKGTTTTLIGNILKESAKKVFVGGNIGNPPIEFIDELTPESIVVLELSSFQLQDLDQSPHIAVVLDIKVDHLDVHKTIDEYIESKRNIIRHQNKNDLAVINADYLTSVDFASLSLGKTYWFSRRKSVERGSFVLYGDIVLRTDEGQFPIAKTADIQLRGEHNLENITAAITASFLGDAKLEAIKKAVKEFKGLEHRLEFVRDIQGVKYYNDSFSTNPDTTIAAINSFNEPIILLVGGSEKNADYRRLSDTIKLKNVKLIIPIGLTAERIVPGLGEVKSMGQALEIAKKNAERGEVVLLSPASASFDQYKNYKERGKTFKDEVNKLAGEK